VDSKNIQSLKKERHQSSVVSKIVKSVGFGSYTSRMYATEEAYSGFIKFSECITARVGPLYYSLGSVIAGLAGIRSPHSVLSILNCVEL
jgi:hypothetical protein